MTRYYNDYNDDRDRGGRGASTKRRSSPTTFDMAEPSTSGRRTKATVKWFNETKGFGFVTPSDSSTDAFLHVSALKSIDEDSLTDGTVIDCEIGQGQKGPEVKTIYAILEVGTPTRSSSSSSSSGGRPARPNRDDNSGPESAEEAGVVKWFNEAKGFGFIVPNAGGKDIFVHTNVCQRAGVDLIEGMRVRFRTRDSAKGPMVSSITAD